MDRVGIVVIGRNEGDRLRRCLEPVARCGKPVVYADSASSDGSPDLARSLGVEVVQLDPSSALSAARGRNEGFRRLRSLRPEADLVQFVDGDSGLLDGWMDRAASALDGSPEVAAVCGRLKELRPDATVYNRLCQMEWDGPAGEISACGGIFMTRVEAFERVGGFNPAVVAWEDDEFCLRLRRAGGKILKLDADMAVHDAAITRFGQWWTRALRAGVGYAQAASLHRAALRQNLSTVFWAFAVPVAGLGAAWPTRGGSLLLFVVYPLLALRIAAGRVRRGDPLRHACLYALFTVLAKGPGFLGLLRFLWLRSRGRAPRIVEYKTGGEPGA